jgi:hypothetical protein
MEKDRDLNYKKCIEYEIVCADLWLRASSLIENTGIKGERGWIVHTVRVPPPPPPSHK